MRALQTDGYQSTPRYSLSLVREPDTEFPAASDGLRELATEGSVFQSLGSAFVGQILQSQAPSG